MSTNSGFERLSRSLYLYRDSCNVYAVHGSEGCLIINAGSGAWLDHARDLPAPPKAVVCTHHFRDHASGASMAARSGLEVYAPFWEREFFEDAEGLFQRRETYIMYDNIWDLFGPVESTPGVRWLHDWEHVKPAGVAAEVIPTAGVSPGAASLLIDVDGRRTLFCGEMIHSPGKIARIAPLQYEYNDLTGGINLLYSLSTARRLAPDVVAPSLGPGLIETPDDALASLETNLRAALEARPDFTNRIRYLKEGSMPLAKVSDSVYQAHHTEASTYFVLSRSGETLAIDFGYDTHYRMGSGYPYPRNRVSTLHSVDEIARLTGRRRIDAVVVTHFHDDHVNGIPQLQRLYGTKCYAGENFADILARPERYAFPCTWPVPIDVESIPFDGALEWNEFTFRVHPMSGHTRFSTIVEFDADGKRFAATGDQYFFWDWEHPGDGACMHNHVYRNGAVLSSFHDSNRIMERIHPDVLLPGHGRAYEVPTTFYTRIAEYADLYQKLHSDLMPLGDDDVHFEVDSRAAWLEPYRVHRAATGPAEPIELTAHVRNPYGHDAELICRLVGPNGWRSEPTAVQAPARAEVAIQLRIVPPPETICRRQAVALSLSSGSDSFGEVAEALVTLGGRLF